MGGEGNDIITDLDGADVLKGGPGNDAIDAGPGNDIPIGNAGIDFINGGANDNEVFAGEGNDFIIAGQGADAVFGDGGDDWIEGGTGQDLLQGDHGAPFFDDPAEVAPGNDIFIGQPGENDYDAEGGDDLMAQNAAIDRNAGAGGFDWAFHQYDTVAADDDMEINNNLVGLPIQVVVNRDRWQETEADSGSPFNDSIKGTSIAPSTIGGAGFTGCDALDQAGVNRIQGLNALVTTFPSPLAPIEALSAAGHCPLNFGAPANNRGNVWAEGDILTGGGGSDTIEGRGANDIIDGDRFIQVRIAVLDGAGVEIGSTDLMEDKALTGTFGPGTDGMTLQQAVFAGLVDPGNLSARRQLVTPTVPAADCGSLSPVNCDTAVFSAALSGYVITNNPNGSVTVSDAGGAAVDGTDTLWNVEQASFCDTPGAVRGTCAVPRTIVPLAIAPPVAPLAALVTPGPGTNDVVFGSVTVGSAPVAQSFTVNNAGNAPLLVSGVTVTGTGASSFTATPDVGCASVPSAGICTITVTFAPASAGALEATVTVTHNSLNVAGSTSTVALSGTGTAPAAPVAGVAPAALAFGSVNTGTTSAAQGITVINNGNAPLTVTSVAVTGANAAMFTATPTGCNAPIAPTATCTISVRFAPTSTGAKAATVSITHNSNNVAGTVSTVTLSGTGATGTPPPPPPTAPRVSMPATFSFGAQRTNANRTDKLQVTNQGPGALVITNVTTSGGAFTATRGDCPASLSAGRSCRLSITFRPTLRQSYTGTVTVTSNASNNPTTSTLTGSGR